MKSYIPNALIFVIFFVIGWLASEYIKDKPEIVCESGTEKTIELPYGNAWQYDCNGWTVVIID